MYFKELRKIMKHKKISIKKLSELTGINGYQLNKKLKGKAEFTLWEIKCISKILSLKGWQVINIFFDEKFPKGNKCAQQDDKL